MSTLTRRGLVAGAAALAAATRTARAQGTSGAPSEATRNLPRTYAGTTLNILWANDPVGIAMAGFSKEFIDATGIALNFTNASSDDRQQKSILDTTTHTNAFDIYMNAYQWKQQLAPYLIDHAHIDQEVKGCPPLDLADFPAGALDVYTKVGAKMMAVPLLASATFQVWNKQAYRQSGLDPDKAPADWQAVYDNGIKLRGDRRYGFNMPAGKAIQCACTWITVFHAFGGSYTDAKGLPTFNSEPGQRATTFIAERLQKISPPGNLTWDFPEMVNAVASGTSAQGFMWPGGFSTLFDASRSQVAHDLGWAPTPQAVLLGGWAVSVSAASRNMDAAKLFVGWITSRDVATRLVRITGQPCRISAFKDPEAVAKFPHLPAMLQSMEGKLAMYMPIPDNGQVDIIIADETNAACA
ncbi:MAG: extracellular solute-binding protein, partial [Acetobacteraceae bacterium]|nr:extracellular solute-binding protein [Acetobacteraceae bacterium]